MCLDDEILSKHHNPVFKKHLVDIIQNQNAH